MFFSNLVKNTPLFLDDKPAVYALRQKAKNSLATAKAPTLDNEAWKYTDVKPILASNFEIAPEDITCGHDCCKHSDSPLFIEIKFCRGQLHIEEFNTPDGLTITPLPLALFEGEYKSHIFNTFNLEDHPFAALNGIYLEQGICIHVEKNTQINQPLHINYNQTDCDGFQINLHNIVILEQGASLEVLETFSSEKDNTYLTNMVNEIYLKTNSKFNHYKKQEESPRAYHVSLNAVKTQNNAHYRQYYYGNGAKICRQENLINLNQNGAAADVYSAYYAKKDCLTDITTNINHNQAETTSNQYAKAVLESNSSAAFQGKIYIAPDAVKTCGHQLHKGLYLDDNAVLNCKPELEIYADNVKCSHGASCGKIDNDQLFYLTSRGINHQDAKQMLIKAHLSEIFSFMPNNEIKNLFSPD